MSVSHYDPWYDVIDKCILTGFLAPDERSSFGRPVGVALGPDGSLLVADDVGNAIWRVTGA
jgi:glucose/arabinose dehydrogenase